MDSMIRTMEQLRQLRQRAVDDLTGQLGTQKQLCQRYERNINALTDLCENAPNVTGATATLMTNQSGYKSHIQRVINWQKQEQALADIESNALQQALIEEACREKTLEVVLHQQQALQARETERREQKNTDAMSIQCWMRQRRS